VNSLVRLMAGDCWLEWDSVVRIYVFSDHLVREGAEQLCYLLPSGDMFWSMHGEVRGA
jgi:hypothetical protein